MTGFTAAVDNISDLLVSKIEHQTHILLQYIYCERDSLPRWRNSLIPFSSHPVFFLFPLLANTSIINGNIYKKTKIRAAKVQLSCSFGHLCSASLVPVGNYLFPVVIIIILQHTAERITHTYHFHLQPAGFAWLPTVPSKLPTPTA